MGLAIKIVLFLLLMGAHNAFAVTYFFSNSGSDANNCTSEGTACATTSKAESLAWNAGDSFLFECGSVWRFQGNENFQSQGGGSLGNPITISSYGTCPTADDYPIFTQSELVTGWASAGTNLWSVGANIGLEAGPNWFFDGLRAAWIEDHDAGCPGSMTENYEVCYSADRETAFVRTTDGDPDNLNDPGAERVNAPDFKPTINIFHPSITVTKIQVLKVSEAIRVGSSNNRVAQVDLVFDDIVIGDTGWPNNIMPNAVADKWGGWSFNIFPTETATGNLTFINSHVYNCGRDCFDTDLAAMDGDILVDGNLFETGYNHNALYIGKGSHNTPDSFFAGTVVVSNNVFREFCGPALIGSGHAGGFADMRWIGNLFEDGVKASTVSGGGITRYQVGDKVGSQRAPDCFENTAALGSFGNDGPVEALAAENVIDNYPIGINWGGGAQPRNLKIHHNTIIDSSNIGIQIGDTNASVEIINNVISKNGGDTDEFLIECHNGSNSACNFLDVQNNYFDPEHSSSAVYRRLGETFTLAQAESTFPQWNANNIGNLTGASPNNLFEDRANADYTPGVGSPLIDAGQDTGRDVNGLQSGNFNGAAPDIGATEVGAEPSVPEPTIDGAIIRAIAPTTLEITFATDSPPMLPATGCAGITLNGTIAAPSSCTRNGSNNKRMDITLTEAPGPADIITMDYAQSSGNITDSADPPVEVADINNFPVINDVGQNLLNDTICTSPNTFADGRDLSNSFDGDTTTGEGSSGSGSVGEFTVTCDLGTNHELNIVRIFGDDDGTWLCTEYDLDHSTDGVNFTNFVTNANCLGQSWFPQDLAGLSTRFIRWTITGNNTVTPGRTQWRELEAYESTAGDPPPPESTVTYGPSNESCYTTAQPGTTGPVIVPDDNDDLERAIEDNPGATVLIKQGAYDVDNFIIPNGSFVAPFDCQEATIRVDGDADDNIQVNDDWTFAGMIMDGANCLIDGNCMRIDGTATGVTVRNNKWINLGASGLTVRGNGAKQVVIQGNYFEGHPGNQRVRGLVQFKDDMGDVVFKENWLHTPDTNTTDNGNDVMTMQGVSSAGLVVTDNLFTGQSDVEQYIDIKRSTAPVTVSHNTLVGPSKGHGDGDGERALHMTLSDNTEAQLAKGLNPTHSIHHNYFKDSWTQDQTTNGTIGAWAMRIGTNRFFSGVLEFNIDDNDKNTNDFEVQNEVFDRVTFRHNTIFNGAVRYQNEACLGDAAFTMDNNIFHLTRIDDDCNPANDWTVTNNLFSNIQDSGIQGGNQGAGNSTDTAVFGSTADANPDFTLLGGTHSQKGALPAPTVSSASIDADCVLKITMSPYNDLYNHGPISQADGTKVTPIYSGSADPTVTATSIQGNVINFELSSCPLSTDTVTFDATHGWCRDSANVGSTFAELAEDFTLPAVLRARCLATTGEAVTNNVSAGGPSTFFVDVSCGTDGDGTTETCGATGPWNTLESALVTNACAGMVDGDILEVKGGTYRETESLAPDGACSGITIQNATGEAVIIDGTVDISGETWNSIGGGVFETTYDFGEDEFPFTAWYDRGAGESRLDLIQSNQTCDGTLAAGKMRYDPATNRICARLDNDTSPAAASFFRIPQKDAAIRFQGGTAGHVTIKSVDTSDNFKVQRFAERGISWHHDTNGHITIDGLDIGWMYDSCVVATSGPQQGAFTVVNSNIHHCGVSGIRNEGDTGDDGKIEGNTITEIQTEPFFEQCSGVGDGCLGTLWNDGAAIRVLNRNGLAHSIADNTITHVGGGNTGRAYGVWLRKWTSNITIDSNYIAHISGLADTGYGIALTGDDAQESHNDIVIKNNRVFDTDVAYGHVYTANFVTEAGENISLLNNTFVNFLEAGIQLELADNAADGGPVSVQNNIIASYSGTPLHINIPTSGSTGWGDFKNNDVYCDACTTGDTFIDYKGQQVQTGSGGSCSPSLPSPSLTQLHDFGDWTISNGTGVTDNRPTNLILSGSSFTLASPTVSKPASNLLLIRITLEANTPGELPHGLRIGSNQNDPAGSDGGGTDFTYDPDASSQFEWLYTLNDNATTVNFTLLEASKVSNEGNDIKITGIDIFSFDDASELPGMYTSKTAFTTGRLTTDANSRTYLDGDPFIIKMLYCDQARSTWTIYPPMGWNMCGRVISVDQAIKAAEAGMYFMYQLSSFVGGSFGFTAATLSDPDKLQGIMDSTQTFLDPKTGTQRPLRDFMLGFYLDNEWGERWDTTPGFTDVIPQARSIAPNRLVYILNGNQGRAIGLAAEGLQDYTGCYVGPYFPNSTTRLGLHSEHATAAVTSGVGIAQLNSLGDLDSAQLDFTGNFGSVARGVNFFRDSPGATANGSTDLVASMTQSDTGKLLAFETAALAEYSECEDEWAGPDIVNNIFTDPGVNLTGDDPSLAISDGSNAENVGITIGLVTVDYEDEARPQGASYDIGADENSGGGPPPGPSATFEQEEFQFYGRYSPEGDNFLGSFGTDTGAYSRGFFNLRFSIVVAGGDAQETSVKLFARLNGGAWTAVDSDPDATVGVYIAPHPGRDNRSITNNYLPLDGRTFTPGVFIDGDTDPINVMPNQGEQVEIEFSLGISSAASPGDEIEFRLRKEGGTDLDTYTKTPKVTVHKARLQGQGGVQQ